MSPAIKLAAAAVAAAAVALAPCRAQDRVFHVLPIWDDLTSLNDDAVIQQQMEKLKAQVGSSSPRFKVGFSFITGPNTARLTRLAELAQKNDLTLGLIYGAATHHVGPGTSIGKLVAADLRLCQWRLDGKTWRGGGTSEDARDSMVPTPSRYAVSIRAEYERSTVDWARAVAAVLPKAPGVINVISFTIEEELALGGVKGDALLADYSPFAVAEFRDWLRHRGLYDTDGKYAGQGAPAAITGGQISVTGKPVSPFHDDPTPADARGTGSSFNSRFGTKFTTWDLAYWDLVKFPQPITDTNFNPSPETGDGATPGGFDAPRVRNDSQFWRAWSWDTHDQRGRYPPGNPKSPAFGFRQHLTRNFVQDIGATLQREGIPAAMLFPHQIPGELWNAERERSSASTIWSGLLPNGNLGITFFGRVDVKRVEQYSQNWGIFEWHPLPGADPKSDKLYREAGESLELYFDSHASAVFPGWWRREGQDKTFPLNDSKFAEALKNWLARKQRTDGRPAGR